MDAVACVRCGAPLRVVRRQSGDHRRWLVLDFEPAAAGAVAIADGRGLVLGPGDVLTDQANAERYTEHSCPHPREEVEFARAH